MAQSMTSVHHWGRACHVFIINDCDHQRCLLPSMEIVHHWVPAYWCLAWHVPISGAQHDRCSTLVPSMACDPHWGPSWDPLPHLAKLIMTIMIQMLLFVASEHGMTSWLFVCLVLSLEGAAGSNWVPVPLQWLPTLLPVPISHQQTQALVERAIYCSLLNTV